jgi:death-on-curing protein
MLAEHGGRSGIRDEGLLDSALGRPQNLFLYQKPTIFELASAYAFGISKNHPFIDGNKRAAFLTTYIFLGRNGWLLSAPEVEATVKTLQLASGQISESEFAIWLEHFKKQCSRSERGFFGSGKALAKEHARSGL